MAKEVWARVGVQFVVDSDQLCPEGNLIDTIRETGVFTGDSYIPAGMYGHEENDKDLNIIVEGEVCGRHREHAPKKCPKCVSDDISSGEIEPLTDDIIVKVHCNVCEYKWTELYKFVNWKPRGEG